MWDNFILIVAAMIPFLLGFQTCRWASAYYDSLKWRGYITIPNRLLYHLFVSGGRKSRKIGRVIPVLSLNRDKMTILGLTTHLLIDSSGLFILFFGIQERVFLKDCHWEMMCAAACWGIFFFIFLILDHINGKSM